jgi:hypothetical protein
VPFGDVGWECGITAFASDYASCLVSSDLRVGCFFVGHHERSVMCRLVMLVGNVGSRLLRQITPRASSHLTYGMLSWFVLCFRRAS